MKPLLTLIGLCLVLGGCSSAYMEETRDSISHIEQIVEGNIDDKDRVIGFRDLTNYRFTELEKLVQEKCGSCSGDMERNYYNGYVDGKASCSQQPNE